ncbi:MAG: hypothetical protein NTY38_04375 [Acidobacteria bacterium]|nr:hypothetical protein [Acidobacteriota bacterium]
MPNRISRRSALLLAAVPALAEPQAASPPRPPNSPAELLESQRKRIRSHSRALAKFKLDPSVEPAFTFRA